MLWSGRLLLGVGLALLANEAAAHGPPSADQLAWHPAQPDVIGVSTTHGLAATSDGGAAWSLTCEEGIGLGGEAHPRLVLTADGRFVAGLAGGPVMSHSQACGYAPIAEMAGLFAVDLRRVGPSRVVILARNVDALTYEVWLSDDDGASFVEVVSTLGPKFHGRSALTAGDRLYVAGTTAADEGVAAVLVGELDDLAAGGTLTEHFIGEPPPAGGAAIIGVDPDDVDHVFAAVYEAPGRVYESSDGGVSWSLLHSVSGDLTGVTLSASGDRLAAAGALSGVWLRELGSGIESSYPDVLASCLTYVGDELWVCRRASAASISVGVLADGRVDERLEQRCLRQPDCPNDSAVAEACLGAWPELETLLSLESCDEPLGGGGESAAQSGSSGGASSSSNGSSQGGAAAVPPATDTGGCQASAGSDSLPLVLAPWLALSLLTLRRRSS